MEKKNKPCFGSYVRALEKYDKMESRPDFAFKKVGMEVLCMYLFELAELTERRCKARKERLERLTELKAPQVIIDTENLKLAERRAEKKLLDSLVSFLFKADYLAQKRMLGKYCKGYEKNVMVDAIDAIENRTCIHCTRSVMDENGKWVCISKFREGELKNDMFGFADACDDLHFKLDDFAEIDYDNYITANKDYGNEFLEKIGKEKDDDGKFSFDDRIEYAISSHHKYIQDMRLKKFLEDMGMIKEKKEEK